MKVKHFLVLFLLAWAIEILGAIFKVLHFPGSALLLLIGGLVQAIALIGLAYKILRTEKLKAFLNS